MIPLRGWLVPFLAVAFLFALWSRGHAETGLASFYGGARHHGRPMANGGTFDQRSNSCAHLSLPFGTVLRVKRNHGRSVLCVVRDRGPYRAGRIVDVSVAAAEALDMVSAGVVPVTIEVVK